MYDIHIINMCICIHNILYALYTMYTLCTWYTMSALCTMYKLYTMYKMCTMYALVYTVYIACNVHNVHIVHNVHAVYIADILLFTEHAQIRFHVAKTQTGRLQITFHVCSYSRKHGKPKTLM